MVSVFNYLSREKYCGSRRAFKLVHKEVRGSLRFTQISYGIIEKIIYGVNIGHVSCRATRSQARDWKYGSQVVGGIADKRVYHATLVLQASVFRVSMQIAGELILAVRKWGASQAGNKMKSSVIEWQCRLTARASATMFAVRLWWYFRRALSRNSTNFSEIIWQLIVARMYRICAFLFSSFSIFNIY